MIWVNLVIPTGIYLMTFAPGLHPVSDRIDVNIFLLPLPPVEMLWSYAIYTVILYAL